MATLTSRPRVPTLGELCDQAGVTIDVIVDYGVDPPTATFMEGGTTLLMGTLGSNDFKITDILTLMHRLGVPMNYEELP